MVENNGMVDDDLAEVEAAKTAGFSVGETVSMVVGLGMFLAGGEVGV